MIPSIPRYLLPHSAELKTAEQKDAWGKPVYTVIALEYVRFEPVSVQRFSMGGDIPMAKGKLFFDALNSLPMGTIFRTGDKIVYGGNEYVITEVQAFSADMAAVHHYEVILG